MKQKQINNLSIDTIANASSLGDVGDISHILETGKIYRYTIDNSLSDNGTTVLTAQGTDAFWVTDEAGSSSSPSSHLEDSFVCGEAISALDIVYFNTSTGKLELAIDDGTGKDKLIFIAKESGVLGDSIKVACNGLVDGFSGLTAGQDYALSTTTAGAFVPFSSLTTGDYAVRIFTSLTATKAKFYDESVIVQVL